MTKKLFKLDKPIDFTLGFTEQEQIEIERKEEQIMRRIKRKEEQIKRDGSGEWILDDTGWGKQ